MLDLEVPDFISELDAEQILRDDLPELNLDQITAFDLLGKNASLNYRTRGGGNHVREWFFYKVIAARGFQENGLLLDAAFSYDHASKAADALRLNFASIVSSLRSVRIYQKLMEVPHCTRFSEYQQSQSFATQRLLRSLSYLGITPLENRNKVRKDPTILREKARKSYEQLSDAKLDSTINGNR